MEMGKSFPQTFVGVNVIVTTKPFKVAPFLTDWVNYKQIQPAMGLLPTTSIRNIFMSFILRRITIIQLECVFLQSTNESSLTR